jgi:hypothetical protein
MKARIDRHYNPGRALEFYEDDAEAMSIGKCYTPGLSDIWVNVPKRIQNKLELRITKTKHADVRQFLYDPAPDYETFTIRQLHYNLELKKFEEIDVPLPQEAIDQYKKAAAEEEDLKAEALRDEGAMSFEGMVLQRLIELEKKLDIYTEPR